MTTSPGIPGAIPPDREETFLESVIRSQRADGGWNLCPSLFDEGIRAHDATQEIDGSLVSCELAATLLVLVQLEDRPDGVPPECEAMVRKAEAWLAAKTRDLAPPEPFPDWRAWARDLLARHRSEAPQQ